MCDEEISWLEYEGKAPSNISPPLELPEGAAVVIGQPTAASWVITPVELGSEKLYIQRTYVRDMECPRKCGAPGPLKVVELEGGLSVVCCETCGRYSWIKLG